MAVRGIRGAIVANQDQPDTVLAAARTLLSGILEANPSLKPEDIGSAIFTVTADLVSAYPAEAARLMGWANVPLLCTLEIPVPEGLPRCIRLLINWNTDLPQESIRHVYLGEAARLRPDLVQKPPLSNTNQKSRSSRPERGSMEGG
jgi:chorismate mutase